VLSYDSEVTNDATKLSAQKTMVKSLGASTNSNTKQLTWNDQVISDAYTSKVKLN